MLQVLCEQAKAIARHRNQGAPAALEPEDEVDLSKVGLDMELYRALAAGWMESTHTFMTDDELELMPFSACLVTLTVGIRFLTDHLSGDTYFRIQRPGQNLDRARAQFEMVRQMELQQDVMARSVAST